ncbi:MAG: Activator of Hsp90 ATPase 1 family protein [Candidatus Saccharibacteria bacterium]|nr:Activator of Hsp90 ATPase 1 family protein [Candidatus Saccharibacteria bacterium]
MKSTFTVQDDQKTLVMTRDFTAPKDKVWAAYTEADKLAKWWGPTGWTTEVKELNFSVGGTWFYIMTCKDPSDAEWYNKNSAGKGIYDAIDAKNSFGYTDFFTDDEGNVLPGMPSTKITVAFAEKNGVTTLTSTAAYATPESLKQVLEMGMEEGFNQTWNNLETFLNS